MWAVRGKIQVANHCTLRMRRTTVEQTGVPIFSKRSTKVELVGAASATRNAGEKSMRQN